MRFTFNERKVKISNAVREYAEKKLTKLSRYFKNDADVVVTATLENNKVRLEVTVKYDGYFFRSTERGEDMREMIDLAQVRIDRQIRKNKTRLEKRLRDSLEFPTDVDVDEDEVQEFEIVKSKKFAIKPMSVEEAILQMNLLGHEFFVFRNMKDETFSIVYRRSDGGYGLIENEE